MVGWGGGEGTFNNTGGGVPGVVGVAVAAGGVRVGAWGVGHIVTVYEGGTEVFAAPGVAILARTCLLTIWP